MSSGAHALCPVRLVLLRDRPGTPVLLMGRVKYLSSSQIRCGGDTYWRGEPCLSQWPRMPNNDDHQGHRFNARGIWRHVLTSEDSLLCVILIHCEHLMHGWRSLRTSAMTNMADHIIWYTRSTRNCSVQHVEDHLPGLLWGLCLGGDLGHAWRSDIGALPQDR